MSISNASATWNGDLKTGTGEMKPANGPTAPFSFKTRFEGEKGTNPEEMVGAALAGCFSMALSLGLATAGATDVKIDTSAKVSLDKVEAGFAITNIMLTTKVSLKGVDAAKFKGIAEETKKNCPVSKALAATKITLEASLV
ncbi:MAG: OsmC family peroxiredoxin [Myxococcota bacterium]|nr:OsmC family peroxiredoxin [Myxococcota bacterium]